MMKKVFYVGGLILAGIVGSFSDDFVNYIINLGHEKSFNLDKYQAQTDYEIVVESFKPGNKVWGLEQRMRINSVYDEEIDFSVLPPKLLYLAGSGRNHKGQEVRGFLRFIKSERKDELGNNLVNNIR